MDWSEMLPEILCKIYNSIPARVHKIRFRSVCKVWRSSAPAPPRRKQIPVDESWSLVEAVVYYLKPTSKNPLRKDMILKIIELGEDGKLRALDVFTPRRHLTVSGVLELSEYHVFELSKSYHLVFNEMPLFDVVISSKDLAGEAEHKEICVMRMLHSKLAYFRLRDGLSSPLQILQELENYSGENNDIVYRNEKFYVVDAMGYLRIVDYSLNDEVVKFDLEVEDGDKYLVESCGKLYLVAEKKYTSIPDLAVVDHAYWTGETMASWFRVFCFNDGRKEWEKVHDLGDFAIFAIGCSSFTVAVTNDLPYLRKNCIYFSPFYGQNAIFDLKTDKVCWSFLADDDYLFSTPLQN